MEGTKITAATNQAPVQGTTMYIPCGVSGGTTALNVTADQLRDYANQPAVATTLPTALVDGTKYTLTGLSADISLASGAIPADTSKGIVIEIVEPAAAIGITSVDALTWYGDEPTISIAAGEHWLFCILDGICSISKLTTSSNS